VRIPIKATARVPIKRPDTYQRLPQTKHDLYCETQPVHTCGSKAVPTARDSDFRSIPSSGIALFDFGRFFLAETANPRPLKWQRRQRSETVQFLLNVSRPAP